MAFFTSIFLFDHVSGSQIYLKTDFFEKPLNGKGSSNRLLCKILKCVKFKTYCFSVILHFYICLHCALLFLMVKWITSKITGIWFSYGFFLSKSWWKHCSVGPIPKWQMVGQEEITSGCTRGDLDQILGKISWQKSCQTLFRLPREVLESLSLGVLERHVDVALRIMV